MTLGVTTVEVNGVNLPMLFPSSFENISVQIITLLKNDLVPNNVSLVQTAPGQAFTVQFYVAITVGLVGSIPVVLREVFAFLRPALLFRERNVFKSTVIPAIFLFLSGCLFAYLFAIPYSLEFLYRYGQTMEILSFFDVTSFLLFVLNFLVVFGLSFELPLVMWATTESNLVSIKFWKQNTKYFFIFIIIMGAFITPDGSGVTMWFISGPLILLYTFGLIVVNKITKSKIKTNQVT